MPNAIDVTGQRFGALVARARRPPRGGKTFWSFLCDCGAAVERRLTHVVAGRTRSCGCLKSEVTAARNLTYGHSAGPRRSPTYLSWLAMHSRCENPGHRHFKNYGGRGIRVCARWQTFALFLRDMGERPAGMTLDRYPNNNGDYEPTNCRWATRSEQAKNTRRQRSSPVRIM